MHESRREYLTHHKSARAWAALDRATNDQMRVTYDPIVIDENSLNGKHVVIVGSGVAGLTTAYELLFHNSDVRVTILEARDRTGGRCLTLRTGDAFTEDKNSDLDGSPGETQVVRFERPVGDSEPYLNAGPGRIPSSHKRLLDYLRRFGVEVEIYVMASDSNLTQMKGGPNGDKPVVNRQLTHNTRGWIAQMVYQNAPQLLAQFASESSKAGSGKIENRVEQLRSLMVTFGDLTKDGLYVVGTAQPGQDDKLDVSDRAGFDELPGVGPGEIAKAIGLDQLLASEYWKKTRFYQPADFLWQPTLFQPVGGMDRVQHAFRQQVAALGGVFHLNSPVTGIDYNARSGQFLITAEGHAAAFHADYCFCNLAIPFLKKILSPRLQATGKRNGFSQEFKGALHAVYKTQAHKNETERFLACTTKVGWQADRTLWQGRPFHAHTDAEGCSVLACDDSEAGVVPIHGGISWTEHPITQIWYPSTAYQDRKGVLTGAYNFADNAATFGRMPVADRLREAKAGAALFGKRFAAGLERGVTIAWQNMAHIKGGWAQWQNVEGSVHHYNHIIQGTGVDGAKEPCFFIVGDQVSSLPGWQEGAIASALNAISRLARPDRMLPHLSALPDTKLMVEGL